MASKKQLKTPLNKRVPMEKAKIQEARERVTWQLNDLVLRKQVHERRQISLADVVRETGLTKPIIYGMSNNTLRELPVHALPILLDYFGLRGVDELVVVRGREPRGEDTGEAGPRFRRLVAV
jgi:hypothetical protein